MMRCLKLQRITAPCLALAVLVTLASRTQRPSEEGLSADDWNQIALSAGARFDTDREMFAQVCALARDDQEWRRSEIARLASTRSRLIATFRHRGQEPLEQIRLSSDGRLLATSGGGLCVWDVESRGLLWTSSGAMPVFSSNGEWLAASEHGSIYVWNARTGTKVLSVSPAELEGRGIEFVLPSPDGKSVAFVTRPGSSSEHSEMHLWDVQESGPECEPVLLSSAVPNTIAFSPSGSMLAVLSRTGSDCPEGLVLWERGSGLRRVPMPSMLAPADGCNPGAISFLSDGTALSVSSGTGNLLVYSMPEGDLLAGPVPFGVSESLSFVSGGSVVGWSRSRSFVQKWDAETKLVTTCPLAVDGREDSFRDRYELTPNDFSSGGSICASAGRGDLLRLWDWSSGRSLPPLRHERQVDAVSIARSAKVVATGNMGGLVRVWDVAQSGEDDVAPVHPLSDVEVVGEGARATKSRESILLVDPQEGSITEIASSEALCDPAFNDTGDGIVVGTWSGEVSCYDLHGNLEMPEIGLGGAIRGVSWSNGHVIAGTAQGYFRWDAEFGSDLSQVQMPKDVFEGCTAVAVTPKGIAWFVPDRKFGIVPWEQLSQSSSYVTSSTAGDVAFSCDGSLLACVEEGTLAVYSVESGDRVSTTSPAGTVEYLSWASGNTLLSPSQNENDHLSIFRWRVM